MKKISVLITATGGGGIGEQIVKALRLSSLPLHIVVADCTKQTAVNADASIQLPTALSSDYLPAVLRACDEHAVQAVFAGSEAELRILSQESQVLQSKNIFLPAPSHDLITLCFDKCALFNTLRNKGFHTPAFASIMSQQELATFLTNNPRWPIVCKPDGKTSASGGSCDVFIARNTDEARFFGTWLLEEHSAFMVQEYVGTPENEFTVGVLHTLDAHFIGSIALKRNLQAGLSRRSRIKNTTCRSELGPWLTISSGISQGHFAPWVDIRQQAEAIAAALGASGPMNLQGRFADGIFYLFEINPRFSGTTSLRAMAGFNEPELLLRYHVLHETLPPTTYQECIITRGLEEHFFPLTRHA